MPRSKARWNGITVRNASGGSVSCPLFAGVAAVVPAESGARPDLPRRRLLAAASPPRSSRTACPGLRAARAHAAEGPPRRASDRAGPRNRHSDRSARAPGEGLRRGAAHAHGNQASSPRKREMSCRPHPTSGRSSLARSQAPSARQIASSTSSVLMPSSAPRPGRHGLLLGLVDQSEHVAARAQLPSTMHLPRLDLPAWLTSAS